MKQPSTDAVIVVVIGSYLLLGGFSLSYCDFPYMHDDGIYAITAKSLSETGDYRIISLPGEPFQHKYPIVFPAILSVVWRIWPSFPENILPMKAVSLLAGAVFLMFAYLLLRQLANFGDFSAAVIVAICAAAPGTCELANSVMSELVYGAITMATLWLLDREFRRPTSGLMGVAIGALAGAAFLTRSVGIALPLAMFGGLVWRKNWRLMSTTAFGLALMVIPIKYCESPASEVARSFEYYVNYGDWFRHTAADVGPKFLMWVPFKNLLSSIVGLSGTMLPSRVDIFPAGGLLNFILLGLLCAGALAILLTLIGISSGIWRQIPAIWTLYLTCYLALLLIWPFPPPPRFFVPVLPLILAACRDGMSRTGWFPAKPINIRLAGIGLLVFLISSGLSAVERIRNARVPIEAARYYEWIKENSLVDDVIACIDDPKCFLFTGRKSVSIGIPEFAAVYGLQNGYVIRPETILEMLIESQAKLLMIEETRGTKALEQLAVSAVERLRSQHPDLLKEIWRDDGESAVIYVVRNRNNAQSTVPN